MTACICPVRLPDLEFMLHGVSRSFGQPGPEVGLTAGELRWALIAACFREQRRLTATQAVAAGIVHEVKELWIPRGSQMITLAPGS